MAGRTPGVGDDRLLVEFLGGDETAFEALVAKYRETVFATVISILRNREAAEEVTEDVFFKLYRKAHTFKGLSSFKTWLLRIAVNTAKNRLRKVIRREQEVSLEVVINFHQSIDNPFRRAEAREVYERLCRAIDSLPSRQREVFLMRHLNGLSVAEVASTLGISEGSVKASGAFALGKLRKILGDSVAALGETDW